MGLEHSPAARQLAEYLGVNPESPEVFTRLMTTTTIPTHFHIFEALLGGMRSESGKDLVKMEWYEASFCSRYLPNLIRSYKSSPLLHSLQAVALRNFMHTPYFSRFMRVSPLSENLLITHAKKMIANDPVNNPNSYIFNLGKYENAIYLLGFLMVYSFHWNEHNFSLESEEAQKEMVGKGKGKAGSEINLKKKLLEVVGEGTSFWNQQAVLAKHSSLEEEKFKDVFQLSWDAQRFLETGKPPFQMLGAIGQMMPGLTCGAIETGCLDDNPRQKIENLMNCSRCKCVAYCSPEHQKADWPRHKKVCFKPNF